MNTLKTTTDTFFDDVTDSNIPVLVDFYAEWCGPCKSIATALEDIAAQYDGKCKIVKVDVDECRDLAMKYGVRSVPTFVMFKNEEVLASKIGASSKADLVYLIDSNI